MDTYYKMINTTRDQFVEDKAKPVAQRRLERGLILDEVAKVEKIEVDEQSLEQEFNNAWASLAMSDPEFSKRTKGGTRPTRELIDAVAMDSANRLLTRRVLDKLKSIATGAEGEAKPAKKATAKKATAKSASAKTAAAKSSKSAAAKTPKAAAAKPAKTVVKKPARKDDTEPVKKKAPAAPKKKKSE